MMKFVLLFHKGNCLTIFGNFAATSERLLQFSCIVAVRLTSMFSEAKD